MKKLILGTVAALAFVGAASAQQAVLGTGAFSSSSSGATLQGNVGSGAAVAGIASSTLSMQGSQATGGFAVAGTNGALSGVATGAGAAGNYGTTSTSGALGVAAAGSGGAFTAVNGTDSNGFAGLGITFP